MDEIIEVKDQFYILVTSARLDGRTRVLKHDDTFAVFDLAGDIGRVGQGAEGLYHDGTRFLSRLELRLEERRPLLLSSAVKRDNAFLAVDLTNPDVAADGPLELEHGAVHVFRGKFLWRGRCYEHLRITNFGSAPVGASLALGVEADFRDATYPHPPRPSWWIKVEVQLR